MADDRSNNEMKVKPSKSRCWRFKYFNNNLNINNYKELFQRLYQGKEIEAFFGQYHFNQQKGLDFLKCVVVFFKRQTSIKAIQKILHLGKKNKCFSFKLKELNYYIRKCLNKEKRVEDSDIIWIDPNKLFKDKDLIKKQKKIDNTNEGQHIQTDENQDNFQIQLLSQLLEQQLKIEDQNFQIINKNNIIEEYVQKLQDFEEQNLVLQKSLYQLITKQNEQLNLILQMLTQNQRIQLQEEQNKDLNTKIIEEKLNVQSSKIIEEVSFQFVEETQKDQQQTTQIMEEKIIQNKSNQKQKDNANKKKYKRKNIRR